MEISKTEYLVNAPLLGSLGALWAGKPTIISPLLYGNVGEISDKDKAELIAAGICNTDGQIVPDILPALDVLGNATAFTRMYLSGGPAPYEFLVYFGPDGKTTSLINVQGEFRINSPAAAEIFMNMTAQTLGSSFFRNASLEADLSPDEALVLFGLVDIQRKVLLRSLADNREVRAENADVSEILLILSDKKGSNQWLGNVMKSLLDQNEPLSGDRIVAALTLLEKKVLAEKTGASWHLSDAGLHFARRMLVFDTSLLLTAGYLGESGEVSVAGFTCLQAGVHDLLFIDASTGRVDMRATSSAEVLEYVRKFLTDSSVHRNLENPSETNSVRADSKERARKFCPQCGTPIQEDLKFCNNCGYKRV